MSQHAVLKRKREELREQERKLQDEINEIKKKLKPLLEEDSKLTKEISDLEFEAAKRKMKRCYPDYYDDNERHGDCHVCKKSTKHHARSRPRECINKHFWNYYWNRESGPFNAVRIGFKSADEDYDYDEEDLPTEKIEIGTPRF